MDKLLDKLRNIGIIAHIDAGKTTTTERILYYAKAIHKIGEVHEGTATMDRMPQEAEKGITIASAAITINWKYGKQKVEACQINIIDTPGHIDFTAEVQRSLRVLDGAVVVMCASGGVEPQSETVWRQANKYNVPRFVYVNKMDKVGADFYGVLAEITDKLGAEILPLQIPIGSGDDFQGVIDLIDEKAIIWKGKDKDSTMDIMEIPSDMATQAKKHRSNLLERLALEDEHFLEKFCKDPHTITEEEIRAAVRKSTISGKIVFASCGSSFKNKGIQPLLDAICYYLPSPSDLPAVSGIDPNSGSEIIRENDSNAPFSALCFKITTDPFVGVIALIRVYSGTLKVGDSIWNSSTEKSERITRFYRVLSNKREPINTVRAGDIFAGVGFKNIKTGHTLCSIQDKIVLESISFPDPVVNIVIEAKKKEDESKLSLAMAKLLDEDPTLRVAYNQETNQIILYGMGELHLEIIIDRLKREFRVEINQGKPQVAYRETLTSSVKQTHEHKKQSGGRGQYAKMMVEIGPGEKDATGLEFVNLIKGGNIPKEYIPAIEAGFKEAMKRGPLAHFPLNNMKVTLTDGGFHIVDSDSLSFEVCAKAAYRAIAPKAKPVLMEPIMKVEITTPNRYRGDVTGDLNRRRGIIRNITDDHGDVEIIKVDIPLSELFGYDRSLRGITSGRGTFSHEFSHYTSVPNQIAEKIIQERT